MRFDSPFSCLPRLTKTTFFRNAIAPEKLTAMMYPQSDGGTAFKYPENRHLRINGIVTRELLQLTNPDLYDSEGLPCLIVLKDDCATDLTVGRYAGLESFLCDEDGVESIEFAIYNYNKEAGAFSAKGGSGSLIFDGLGRMVYGLFWVTDWYCAERLLPVLMADQSNI